MSDAPPENLEQLHGLLQRAQALKDRLAAGPRALAARQARLQKLEEDLERRRKTSREVLLAQREQEGRLKLQQSRTDELRVKLNTVKKNDEYKAILTQISNDRTLIRQSEEEILTAMGQVEELNNLVKEAEQAVEQARQKVQEMEQQVVADAGQYRAKLDTFQQQIEESERLIPHDDRDQYRRLVRQRGADSMAVVEEMACSGCFTALVPQAVNNLINGGTTVYCGSCGRILYLSQEATPELVRRGRV